MEYFILLKTLNGKTSDNQFGEISEDFDSANFVVEQRNRFNESCSSINFLAVGCHCCVTSSFQKKNNQLFPFSVQWCFLKFVYDFSF